MFKIQTIKGVSAVVLSKSLLLQKRNKIYFDPKIMKRKVFDVYEYLVIDSLFIIRGLNYNKWKVCVTMCTSASTFEVGIA